MPEYQSQVWLSRIRVGRGRMGPLAVWQTDGKDPIKHVSDEKKKRKLV